MREHRIREESAKKKPLAGRGFSGSADTERRENFQPKIAFTGP